MPVFAKQEGVDAVGSCVGLRGIRIQNIVNELHGEKIDVVPWAKDPKAYITRALSPSQVMRVKLDEEENTAVAVVPENQLSLAIGKEGQNARLAAKLTNWKVEIKSKRRDGGDREGRRRWPRRKPGSGRPRRLRRPAAKIAEEPVAEVAEEPAAEIVEEPPVEAPEAGRRGDRGDGRRGGRRSG